MSGFPWRSLLLLLAPAPAQGLSATATFGLQDAPHCALPPELPWCPLGHEDNGTSDLGDDTIHPSTVIDHITVDVDPGVPGVQPIRFRLGDEEVSAAVAPRPPTRATVATTGVSR